MQDFERYEPSPVLQEMRDLIDEGHSAEALERLLDMNTAGLSEADRGAFRALELICLHELDREREVEARLDELFREPAGQTLLCAGIECSEREHYPLAERILRLTAERWPGSANPAYNLALVLHRDERYEEALEWTDRTAATGEWAPVHFQRGETLRALNRLEEAAASYRRFLEEEPGDTVAWHILANVESDRGRFDEAFECYERALLLEPNALEVLYNKAIAAARAEDHGRLLEAARSLHASEPGSWRALAAAAILAEEEGDRDRALELRQDALDAVMYRGGEEDLSPDIPYVLATALQFMERHELKSERDALLDRALSLGLLYPDVLEVVRHTRGSLSPQARLYKVLVELRADDPEFIDQCREFFGEYDGNYGYVCPYRVWAEDAGEAGALALEFEIEHGAGSDGEVTETEEIAGPEEQHLGVAWRGEMHAFRADEGE